MHFILLLILSAALLCGCNTAPATLSSTSADAMDTTMMKAATVADPCLWLTAAIR